MSLYRHFNRISPSQNLNKQNEVPVAPSHLPSQEESGLGKAEFSAVVASVADISDPGLVASGECSSRKKRGKYEHYSNEQKVKIGKYALENGNERARRHFLSECPNLKESSIRNFKKAYQ